MSAEIITIQAQPGGTEIERANRYMPVMSMDLALARRDALISFVQAIMKEGTDYGKIPGVEKNVLLKAGAEKLCTFFGLSAQFIVIEQQFDWDGTEHGGSPFFYIAYKCRLSKDGVVIGEGDGSCTGRESKYAWRWIQESDLPPGVDKSLLMKKGGRISEFQFALDKRETTGKYGKPASYWQAFDDAQAAGTARKIKRKDKSGKEYDAVEIDSTVYRVPNPDIADQVNTIMKMAQKRALVAAVLISVNASEYFTQDVEDFLPDEHGAAGTDSAKTALIARIKDLIGLQREQGIEPIVLTQKMAESLSIDELCIMITKALHSIAQQQPADQVSTDIEF